MDAADVAKIRQGFADLDSEYGSKIVHSPDHYTQGIETFDFINSHNMGYAQGACIKYLTRYKMKNGLEDLLKCKWYLDKLIKEEIAREEMKG